MPITKGEYKCTKCGETQELTSAEERECINGCYEIKLYKSGFGYSYSTKGNKTCCVENVGFSITTYSKDEILELDDKCLELWNKIKDFKFEEYFDSCFSYESYVTREDGERILSSFNANIDSRNPMGEYVELRIDIDLEREKDTDKVYIRLNRFYSYLEKIRNKEIKVVDIEYLKADEELDWSREQKDLYDYTFWV